jgi:hypothetical protein
VPPSSIPLARCVFEFDSVIVRFGGTGVLCRMRNGMAPQHVPGGRRVHNDAAVRQSRLDRRISKRIVGLAYLYGELNAITVRIENNAFVIAVTGPTRPVIDRKSGFAQRSR